MTPPGPKARERPGLHAGGFRNPSLGALVRLIGLEHAPPNVIRRSAHAKNIVDGFEHLNSYLLKVCGKIDLSEGG